MNDQEAKKLFDEQKKTLDIFLERGAISKAQYEKSLGVLQKKLMMEPEKTSDLGQTSLSE